MPEYKEYQPGDVTPSIEGKVLGPSAPTEYTFKSGRKVTLTGELPDYPDFSRITYADDANNPQNPEDLPYWDMALGSEKWLTQNLPRVGGAMSDFWGNLPDDVRNTLTTVGKPVAAALSPILGAVMKVFTFSGNLPDQAMGMVRQAQWAQENGMGDEWAQDMDKAWRAGAMFSETFRGVKLDLPSSPDFKPGLIITTEDSQAQRMANIRGLMSAGWTDEEIRAKLSEELGALSMGSMMTDLASQFLDPINFILPAIKPVEKIKDLASMLRVGLVAPEAAADLALKYGDELGRLLNSLDEVVPVLGVAEGIAEEAPDLVRALEVQKQLDALDDLIIKYDQIAREGAQAALKPIDRKLVQLLGSFSGESTNEIAFMKRFGGLPLGMEGALITKRWWNPFTWFQLTPQAKVHEMVTGLGDMLGVHYKDAKSIDQILRTAAALSNDVVDPTKFGNLFVSYEGRALQAYLRATSKSVEDLVSTFNGPLKPLRDDLEALGRLMSIDSGKVLGKIQKNGVENLWDEVQDLLKVVDGVEPTPLQKHLITKAADGRLTLDTLKSMETTFLKDNSLPFDLESLKLHLIGRATEAAADQALLTLGLDAKGMFTKATDALKAAEALAFLRINPSYPIRNFFNNEVTLAARGVWGTMTGEKITQLWARIGIEPARLGEGFGPAEVVSKEAATGIADAIRAASRAVDDATIGKRGWLDNLSDAIKNFKPLGKFDTGQWAAGLEASASRRAYTTGYLKAWRNVWKPGTGFDNVEEFLAKHYPDISVADLGPDFSRGIHRAIRSSLGETEVDGIFFKNLRANIENVLDEAGKKYGVDSARMRNVLGSDIVDSIADDLGRAIETGGLDAVDNVFDTAYEAVQAHIDDLVDNTIKVMTEEAAARIVSEGGPTAYLSLWSELNTMSEARWSGYLGELTDEVASIRLLPTKGARTAAWQARASRMDTEWARHAKMQKSYYEGMVLAAERHGISIGDDVVKPFDRLIAANERFFTGKNKLLKEFFGTEYGDGVARDIAWQRARGKIDGMYTGLIDDTYRYSRELDEHLVSVIKQAMPEKTPMVSAWRETVHSLRRAYQRELRDFNRTLDPISDAAIRQKMQDDFVKVRIAWQNKIHQAERAGLESVATDLPFGAGREIEQEVVDIYNGLLAKYGNTPTLYQLAEEPQEAWVARIAKEIGVDPADPNSMMPINAVRRAELEEATVKKVGSVLEEAWGGNTARGTVRKTGYEDGVNLANESLNEAQAAGKNLSEAVESASAKIANPETRAQWRKEASAFTRAIESGNQAEAHIIVYNSDDIARRVFKTREAQQANGLAVGSAHSPLTGHNYSRVNGYSVSVFKELGKEVDGEVTEEMLAQFIRENVDIFSDPRTTIGTRTVEGKTYIDVAVVTPDKADALRFGKENGQLAVFDLHNMEDIPVEGAVEAVPTTDLAHRLDGLPFREPEEIELTRHMDREGLRTADPLNPDHRTGVPVAENIRDDRPPTMNYYAAGQEPEDIVLASARHKYTTTVFKDRVYNWVDDPEHLKVKIEIGQTAGGEKVFGDAWDATKSEIAIRDAGYAGYQTDRGVKVFEELTMKETRLWNDPAGNRMLFQAAKNQRQQIRADLQLVARKIKGVTKEQADGMMILLDARARAWSLQTGGSVEEWYIKNLYSIRPGGGTTLERIEKAIVEAQGGTIGKKPIVKGAMEMLEDGRAVIRAFESADMSTLLHETAHVFRKELLGDDMEYVVKWYKTVGKGSVKLADDGVTLVGKAADISDLEEKFARGFERWLRTGRAPTAELETLFTKFKRWMRSIYETIKGSEIDVRLNRDIKGVFERLFTGGDEITKAGLKPTQFESMGLSQMNKALATDELWFSDGRKLLDTMKDAARAEASKPPLLMEDALAGMSGNKGARIEQAMRHYAQNTKSQMKDATFYSMKHGEMMRDSALLNYSRRTHFDMGMAHVMPFGFWTTHSMYNWGLWSLDHPFVLSTFLKSKRWLSHAGTKDMPTRFRDTIPVPFGSLPWIPDWMGPAYINPFNIALPFNFWLDPIEGQYYQGVSIENTANNILSRRLDEGSITQEEYDTALTGTGDAWTAALNEAKATRQQDNSFDVISSLLAPHAPLVWAYHAAQGTTDEIGPFLPATRTIKGISSLLGAPGPGVNPEGWLRKGLGLPEFDKWDDYRVDRSIANMVATGELSVDAGMIAMQERGQNPAFLLAQERAMKESGTRALFGAFSLPIMLYPLGEEESRNLADGLYDAYDAQAKGDDKAVSQYFQDHPEVKARLALFDSPEERMRTFLVDQIWGQWHSLRSLEKNMVSDVLGEDFQSWFLDRETRNVDQVPMEKLQSWAALIGGKVPGQLGPQERPIAFPPDQIVRQVETFYAERRRNFGTGIFDIQSDYFKLAKGAARKDYLRQNPSLKAYWQWREDWLLANPSAVPYLVEDETKRPQYTSVKALEEAKQQEYRSFSLPEWQSFMGESLFALVSDNMMLGLDLQGPEKEALTRLAKSMGMSVSELMSAIRSSYQGG